MRPALDSMVGTNPHVNRVLPGRGYLVTTSLDLFGTGCDGDDRGVRIQKPTSL